MNEQKWWIKFLVIFFYHGIGSVLPLVLAMLEKNPSYLILIPITKALWETVENYLKDRGLLGQAKWH